MREPLSVVVITFNNADTLDRCLSAVGWAEEIVVLDSGSTDATVEIARRQMAAGAARMCCQNVAEAEAMEAGGINSILLSNEIIGVEKAKRLAQVARTAKVGVCVDHVDQVKVLADAAREADITFDVLIEIDVGMGG